MILMKSTRIDGIMLCLMLSQLLKHLGDSFIWLINWLIGWLVDWFMDGWIDVALRIKPYTGQATTVSLSYPSTAFTVIKQEYWTGALYPPPAFRFDLSESQLTFQDHPSPYKQCSVGPFLEWSLASVDLFHLRDWVEEVYVSWSMKRGTIKAIIRTLPKEVRNDFILEESTNVLIFHSGTRKSPVTLSKPTASESTCKQDPQVMWSCCFERVPVSCCILDSLRGPTMLYSHVSCTSSQQEEGVHGSFPFSLSSQGT